MNNQRELEGRRSIPIKEALIGTVCLGAVGGVAFMGVTAANSESWDKGYISDDVNVTLAREKL